MTVPFFHGPPPGRAQFKAQPEDFVVEELLGFEPSGEGEHCLLWVEKRGVDSNEVVSRFADALGIRRRLVSHCGLKDRQAITRQWFSLHLPGAESPTSEQLASEGVRVLRIERHRRKLRRGFHQGNRFTIRLREVECDRDAAEARWAAIADRGAPNLFGPQRFGNSGENVDKALAMFRGDFTTRNPLLRGLLLSAARSFLFNEIVTERLRRACWDTPLMGEVFGFAQNRSLILPGRERGDEAERLAHGKLELTAALWGKGEPLSTGEVLGLENERAARHPELVAGLVANGLRQERRVLRVRPGNPAFDWVDGDIVLGFALPKGTYATSLLREFVELDIR